MTEVIEAIEKAAGYAFDKEFVPARSTDVAVACLDISKARRILNWTPKIEFPAGIASTVAHLGTRAVTKPNLA